MIVLTREDILLRLLETAIRLYFANGDYISVHVLASAAYKTLSDITSKSGLKLWLTDAIGHEALSHAYDVIRHASRDSGETLDFVPGRNLWLLAASISVFETVFKYRTTSMSVLMIGFVLTLPAGSFAQAEALTQAMAKYIPEGFNTKEVAKLDRMEFFKKSMLFFEVGGGKGI